MSQERVDETFGPVVQRLADAAMSGGPQRGSRPRDAPRDARHGEAGESLETPNRARSIDLGTLKASAERMASASRPVRDLDPAQYARAERASALKASELWGRGERRPRSTSAEARLFNQLLYRAARDAIDEIDKAEKRFQKVSDDTRAALGKADPAFRDVHDTSSRRSASATPAEGQDARSTVMKVIDERAADSTSTSAALKKLLAKPLDWGELTVDEARNVRDAITNLRHLAKEEHVELGEQKQTKDAWFKDLEDALSKRPPLPPEPMDPGEDAGLLSKLKHLGRGADAILTDVAETYAQMLDGGDRNGPMHRLLVDAGSSAATSPRSSNRRSSRRW
jgi:polyhydroxyalkanoate synthesis regulator phasin